VYDMYPWDGSSAGPASQGGRTRKSRQAPRPQQQRAVQFALDRRDNGGDALDTLDALSGLGQPAASPARQ